MPDLFPSPVSASPERDAPLPERLRPQTLAEVVGQPQLLGENGSLRRLLESGRLQNLIFWGPPGSGKTTIARLLAGACNYRFVGVSAVMTSTADLKKIFATAATSKEPTLLFVDEIHRFNRSQQDSFLAPMEDGTITLIGATTENPSFELNAAILSRARVMVLNRLDEKALMALLTRAEAVVGRPLPLTEEARMALVAGADGDGRFLLVQAETLFADARGESGKPLDVTEMSALLARRVPIYDKNRDGHYDLISALHKSVRGSDPDAALYWLARMLAAGEEPLYLLRRLVRMASEDIGLADSNALRVAIAARDTYMFLGSPEGDLALAHACLYMATAPKSNRAYVAFGAAKRAARESGSLPPPRNIVNAPTKLMQELGYAKDYHYDHNEAFGFSGDNYWPDGMERQHFYTPTEHGMEKRIAERLAFFEKRRLARHPPEGEPE